MNGCVRVTTVSFMKRSCAERHALTLLRVREAERGGQTSVGGPVATYVDGLAAAAALAAEADGREAVLLRTLQMEAAATRGSST
jgi:hypothetical protein